MYTTSLKEEVNHGLKKLGSQLFHDGGRYHIETSPLTCSANQRTGFYMISASIMKELITIITGVFLRI